MQKIIEGIVLKTSDYQEKSKILQIFSYEHGLIGVYLKGANNYRSKNYLLSQPITHASFNVSYNSGLSSCYNGEMINSFGNIKTDFKRNVYVFHMFELLLKNLEQHIPNEYIYNLLLKLLLKMNSSTDIDLVHLYTIIFELKLLYYLGITPQFSNCVVCGSTNDIANFDIYKGGFVCKNCQDFRSRVFNIETLKTMIDLFTVNIDSIDDLTVVDKSILSELRFILNEYYSYHLGVKTNSSKYFS